MLEVFRIILGGLLVLVVAVFVFWMIAHELLDTKGGCLLNLIKGLWPMWLLLATLIAAWAIVGFLDFLGLNASAGWAMP